MNKNGAVNSEQNVTPKKLTAPKQRLFNVLCDPDHVGKTVTELCEIANISRTTYYRIMHDEEFATHLEKEKSRLLKSAVYPTIKAFAKEAANGSYQHGKAILIMTGDYVEITKQQIEGELKHKLEADIRAEVRAEVEQELNVYGNVAHHVIEYDLSNLTDEELENLEKIQRKLDGNT